MIEAQAAGSVLSTGSVQRNAVVETVLLAYGEARGARHEPQLHPCWSEDSSPA